MAREFVFVERKSWFRGRLILVREVVVFYVKAKLYLLTNMHPSPMNLIVADKWKLSEEVFEVIPVGCLDSGPLLLFVWLLLYEYFFVVVE